MTKENSARQGQGASGLAALVKLLACLADRRFQSVETFNDGGETQCHVCRIDSAENESPTVFGPSVLRAAKSRDWIAVAGPDGRLVLTDAGRQALKKARSQLTVLRAAATKSGPPNSPAPKSRSRSREKAAPEYNAAESPLSWLRGRRDAAGELMMRDTLLDAGERLRADLTFAQLTPRVTMSWSGNPVSGTGTTSAAEDLADNVMVARNRVTAALRAVGPELCDILIDVCGHLRGLEEIARAEGWPRRSAKLLLQRSLSALARHYGLEPEVAVERRLADRLRHWGTEDYRPNTDRWTRSDT